MPDVGSVQTSWLPEFSIRDALLPLDDYWADSELNGLINQGALDFNKEIVQEMAFMGFLIHKTWIFFGFARIGLKKQA